MTSRTTYETFLQSLPLVMALTAALVGCAPRPVPGPPASAAPPNRPSSESLYDEGIAWLRRGDLIRAERYLALSIDAGYPEQRVLPTLLEICVRSSRLRAALDHGERYLRRNPDAWRVRQLVAALQLALGDRTRALEELERLIADDRADAATHYMRAHLLAAQAEAEAEASASYEAYLARAPHGAHASEARRALARSEVVSDASTASPQGAPR